MASFTERIDGSYTVQTLNASDVVTFSGATANAAEVVIDGDLTVTGNATLLGNISADQIFNGNSSIGIVSAGGNANVTIGGVANVAVFSVDGLSAAGNITAGNYFIGNGFYLSGVASGTIGNIGNGSTSISVPVVNGNIISNVGGTGNTVVTATTGQYVTGIVSASGNILNSGNISTSGTVLAPNVFASINVTSAVISASGNVTGGNLLTA